ncbi:LTV1 homolog (S. cerevisiae), isoform CRA_b [Rattus norvegicus]|uniref:LTV1 homolog (S. cerevisiae), isoform CRA_b n=1 Tax=Rattus norvegicus TaxID=10116 RepID=A6JP56_RAT|nr:LTV1 homolog (S. cerevisiae), isoform CRA_b [Rattus norvegicus]
MGLLSGLDVQIRHICSPFTCLLNIPLAVELPTLAALPDYFVASQKEKALYREEESCVFSPGPPEPERPLGSR